MTLLTVFAGVGLVLAIAGIYGLIAYSVTQRTRELGIRMALGALPSGIRWLVLRQCLAPVGAGLACGLIASGIAGRLLSSLLFGVSAADPVTLAAVAIVLAAIAAVAAYIPARRATRLDPVVALRED